MLTILTLAPWLLLVASLILLVRRRPRLQDYPSVPTLVAPAPRSPEDGADAAGAAAGVAAAPRVSMIVPTLNDATRIGLCLSTLLGSDYPDFEVLVVDHDSVDGTREMVESIRQRSPHRLRLLRSGDVPEGRPWRAWACLVGAREATGDLLLFTEPGTVHAPDVLGRAVTALQVQEADLLTVRPRLSMHGFWERLIMPHIWLVLRARFPSARLVNRSRSPRNAFAHHQFLLFRREAYEEIGGHEVVAPGAVEDLAVPQAVMTAGRRLFLVHGGEYLETRMFRTFADITGGWTGAVPPASRTTVAPWAELFVPWVAAGLPIVLFVVPPVALLAGLVAPGGSELALWGFRASLLSLLFWLATYAFHRIRPAYAMAYPVGALITAVIFVRSILRPDGAMPGSG